MLLVAWKEQMALRSIKIQHRNIGECQVLEECAYMQLLDGFDPSSLYVVHEGQLKEVSRHMFSPADLKAYDTFCAETKIDPKAA